MIHYYKLDMRVMFISEILVQNMYVPDEMKVIKTRDEK